jgi:hypothetical protein
VTVALALAPEAPLVRRERRFAAAAEPAVVAIRARPAYLAPLPALTAHASEAAVDAALARSPSPGGVAGAEAVADVEARQAAAGEALLREQEESDQPKRGERAGGAAAETGDVEAGDAEAAAEAAAAQDGETEAQEREAAGTAPPSRPAGAAAAAGDEEGDVGAELAAPTAEHGPVVLVATPLAVPLPRSPFDAPRHLEAAPRDRAERLPPEVAAYRDVFAAAATAAATLHAGLTAEVERGAETFRTLGERLASMRQAALDASLDTLGAGLDEALAEVDAGTTAATASLEAIALAARRHVHGTAARVKRTMAARAARVERETRPFRDEGRRLAAWAGERGAAINRGGGAASHSLQGLAATVRTALPRDDPRGRFALRQAMNEVLTATVPPAARRSATGVTSDRQAQAIRMGRAARQLEADVAEAMQPFDAMVRDFRITGPAQVETSRRAAVAQLRRTTVLLREGLEEAGAAARVSLIEQHNAQRTALVGTAEAGAEAEDAGLAERVRAAVAAGDALAAGQGAAVSALHRDFAARRDQPEEEFARYVVASARGAETTGRAVATERRAHLAAEAVLSRAAATESTRRSGAQLRSGGAAAADGLRAAASATSAALGEQAEGSRQPLMDLARPVAGVLRAYPEKPEKKFQEMLGTLADAVFAGAHGNHQRLQCAAAAGDRARRHRGRGWAADDPAEPEPAGDAGGVPRPRRTGHG